MRGMDAGVEYRLCLT